MHCLTLDFALLTPHLNTFESRLGKLIHIIRFTVTKTDEYLLTIDTLFSITYYYCSLCTAFPDSAGYISVLPKAKLSFLLLNSQLVIAAFAI